MHKRFFRFLLFLFLLFFIKIVASAQVKNLQKTDSSSKKQYVVAIAGGVPFVVDPATSSGISLEIWQALAAQLNWHYKTMTFTDVPAALRALDSGKVDAVVGPVSVTSERETMARFSQPYYQSSLSILSRSDPPSLWSRVKPLFSWKFFVAVGVFVLILAGVGFLLWLAENKKNPEQFDPEIARGVGDGMWCAIVTMSTTGYGDKAPLTTRGRVVMGCWMVISIIFATSMVAGIASTLTLSGLGTSSIATAQELSGKKVATVSGSPAEIFIKKHNAKEVAIQTLEQGYNLLKKGDVDAVVFDRPQILYFLKEHHDKNVSVSTSEYAKKGYGFAFPLKSNAEHKVNIALLKLQESGRVDRIINEWLNGDDEN